jgi:predicted nuclease of predicted toxin-antitoxin system
MMPIPSALRLYLDEDVDVLLADLLAARGFDCLTSVSAGHLAWGDEAHLAYAVHESRVLISHNRRDFEQLAIRWWGQQKSTLGFSSPFAVETLMS